MKFVKARKRFARDLNYKMLQKEMKFASKDQRLTREEVRQTRLKLHTRHFDFVILKQLFLQEPVSFELRLAVFNFFPIFSVISS